MQHFYVIGESDMNTRHVWMQMQVAREKQWKSSISFSSLPAPDAIFFRKEKKMERMEKSWKQLFKLL